MALFGIAGWGLGRLLYRRRWRDGPTALRGTMALHGLELDWLVPRNFPAATTHLNARLQARPGCGLLGMATGIATRLPARLAHIATEPVYAAVWILGPALGLGSLPPRRCPPFSRSLD